MLTKGIKVILLIVLMLSFSIYNTETANAATKVMWGKTELKQGQLGKITILSNTSLLDKNSKVVRTLKKGEEYRVYSYKSNDDGLFGIGGGLFVQKNGTVKYETPSKSKLELLNSVNNQPLEVHFIDYGQGEIHEIEYYYEETSYWFENCTELRKFYPNGVGIGHQSYQFKLDKNFDGWACEPD
ncbi:excalibur calcium-binding domain-containing protein [Psychrobacillus sp.]|uniref:excalibur calcium-binding domain-containing protein n=1 Tax=Psychrobacillus sp. TaxID=1871623 RepID=UPI0028BF2D62|nr:excalibur calcium-binding domain-containing protein [Psychrobacillus sp.]